ncbi:MAG: hypothetical protein CMM50_05680 [Rhodospirillaceae bacterium]|nr:hypothetical protein [Rhodospirillaceae bacterium]
MSVIRLAPTRRHGVGLLAVATIALGAWLAGLVVFVAALPRSAADTDSATDAIVVLTGGSQRLTEGLALLEADRAERLFISGVYRGVDVSEILRLQEEDRTGIMDRIELGHAATDTRGNARETAEWAARKGIRRMRLVTGNYHMPRSLLEFRMAMSGVEIIPHPVAPDSVRLDHWWQWPGSARLLAVEYSKYLAAWLRYGLFRAMGGLGAR